MYAQVTVVNRSGDLATLICRTDDPELPCVRLEVRERAAGTANLVRVVPGDRVRVEGEDDARSVYWTPRYGTTPEADRVTGVDYDILLG